MTGGPALSPRVATVLALGGVGVAAGTLVLAGVEREGVLTLVRAMARTAALLYFASFGAAGWTRTAAFGPSVLVGAGFAHFLHLGALAALAAGWPDPFFRELRIGPLVAGVVLYALLGLSVIGALRRQAPGRALAVGGWLLWGAFTSAYVTRAFADLAFLPLAVAGAAAAVLRLRARR